MLCNRWTPRVLLLGAVALAAGPGAAGAGAGSGLVLRRHRELGAGAGAGPLICDRRKYKFKVTQTDQLGRKCWDDVSVWSCWGRCDSNEVSDWRFPFKRSYHPVCMHDVREPSVVNLRNCDPDAEPGTERYEFLAAKACRCMVCKSTEAACEGVGVRSHKPLSNSLLALAAASSLEELGPVGLEELELNEV